MNKQTYGKQLDGSLLTTLNYSNNKIKSLEYLNCPLLV